MLTVHSLLAQTPEFGAQVMIPRDKEKIEHLFKTLADHKMYVARIWTIFDPYNPGEWDFTYYDYAFDVAEKYGIGICPTLGPIGSGVSRVVEDEGQFDMAKNYIKTIVLRYKDHPALDTWMLLNEPGMPPTPHPLAIEQFREWLNSKYGAIDAMWGNYSDFDSIQFASDWMEQPGMAFTDWHTFWRSHLIWSLQWIADEVRKWDPVTPLHANPHSLVGNLAEISYDLPSWMDVINSMGGSMHPSWHFGELLTRDQYALGASYECDLLRGSAEPLPYWITELQGGNNLYRPPYPFSPSDKDIAQFLWTIVGSGGKRIIYWKLDPSSAWSLLDFQGRPSERINTTKAVSEIVKRESAFFENAEAYDSPITILLSLETMTQQLATEGWNIEAESDHAGRSKNAHLLSALGYYRTFLEMGVPVNMKHVHHYDWQNIEGPPRLAIMPHITAINPDIIDDIEAFVSGGNHLIISGLTGIYDQNRRFLPTSEFPLQDMLGSRLKEIRIPEIYGEITLQSPAIILPYHLWVGEIETFDAQILGQQDQQIIAIKNQFGKGNIFWIPSMIGIPAFEYDNTPLENLLKDWARLSIEEVPIRFDHKTDHCMMRTLAKDDQYVTVVTNGCGEQRSCTLRVRDLKLKPHLLWGRHEQVSDDMKTIDLGPRETVVIRWQKASGSVSP